MPSPTLIELVYLVCIAHVWARGSIFQKLRTRGPAWWRLFADCPFCVGWWVGVVGHFFVPASVIYVLGVGSLVATCTLALCAFIRRL